MKLKKSVCALAVMIIAVFPVATVFCAGSSLSVNNVSVSNNRLFDVSIEMQSQKALSCATFTLKYDKSSVSFRGASSSVSNSQVKYNDKNSTVKVIFLCAGGVRINKMSQILTVRFKSIKEGNSSINVSAYDCVDNYAENFKAPKGAVCNVSVSGTGKGSVSGNSRQGRVNSAKEDLKKSSDKSNENKDSGDDSDKLEDSEDNGLLSAFDSTLGGEKSLGVTAIFLILAIIASVVAVAVIVKTDRKKAEKMKNDYNDDD